MWGGEGAAWFGGVWDGLGGVLVVEKVWRLEVGGGGTPCGHGRDCHFLMDEHVSGTQDVWFLFAQPTQVSIKRLQPRTSKNQHPK